jgi:hypothetical protein
MTELAPAPVPESAPPAPNGAAPATPPAPVPEPSGAGGEADWRSAWSEALKLDDKVRARLDRFNAPHDVFNSYLSLEQKLSDSRAVRVPGADATPEDIAAWNKARGVPDTPDGYKVEVAVPDGLTLQDGDKAFLKGMTERLHKAGADPRMVNEAHAIFYEQAAEAAAQRLATEQAAAERTEQVLQKEWGRQYKENVAWAVAAAKQFGLEQTVEQVRLEDGTLLGDHPEFIKAMAKIGRMNAEDPLFLEAAGKGTGQGIEERKAALMQLRISDPPKYQSSAVQDELQRINAALLRNKELSGAR